MANSFGEIIKTLRINKGMSQQQLADILCAERSTISGWETGRRMPHVDIIQSLADALDADVRLLMQVASKEYNPFHVIVVDDERIILDGSISVIREVLPDNDIIGFVNPREALDFARENTVSIAFLDIEMRNISGIDVCRELLEINPQTNVIFLTAYPDYALDAWSTGASGFVVKPVSEEAISEQLSVLRYPPL